MAFADPGGGRIIKSKGGNSDALGAVTLAEACSVGDVLGYSSGWKLALATVGTAIQGRFVALAAGAIGDVVPVATDCIINGYTGGTPGNYVYVAESTDSGEITETAPTTTGDCNVIIGIVMDANTVRFFINSRVDSLA